MKYRFVLIYLHPHPQLIHISFWENASKPWDFGVLSNICCFSMSYYGSGLCLHVFNGFNLETHANNSVFTCFYRCH